MCRPMGSGYLQLILEARRLCGTAPAPLGHQGLGGSGSALPLVLLSQYPRQHAGLSGCVHVPCLGQPCGASLHDSNTALDGARHAKARQGPTCCFLSLASSVECLRQVRCQIPLAWLTCLQKSKGFQGGLISAGLLKCQRLEALALQETGAYEAALETLRFLQARQPRQWYLAADLSKALDAAGQRQEATSWALACLGMPGPIEGRIRIMERSTTWLAEAGHMDAARETCVLAWILAQQHQWERRTRATEALMTQWGWSRPAKTPRLQDQLQIARSHWTTHGGAKPRLSNPDSLDPARTVDQDQQRLGTIAQWHADRGYGFVRDQSGGMHFFLLRDAKGIPGGPISGMRVTCKIEPSFDRKKGKPSTAARNLMPSPDDERM